MEKEPQETSTQVPGESGERKTEGERDRGGDRDTERGVGGVPAEEHRAGPLGDPGSFT